MSRNNIDKEALIKAFKKCVHAMYPNDKLPKEESDRSIKIALRELAETVQRENTNPQSYNAAIYQYDEAIKLFGMKMKYRLDRSYNKELIKDTIKKDHLEEYPIKQAAALMGYKDEESVVAKIHAGEIKATNRKKPDGKYDKFFISREEIYKHKRPEKK